MPPTFYLLLLTLAFVHGLHAAETPSSPTAERLRGGKFEWARLQTSGVYWNRHANGDPALLAYLRRLTVLNLDPVWHSVRATTVEALSVYPFIYCDNLTYLTTEEARNFGEYLRRGGFFFVDACENPEINTNLTRFLQTQVSALKAQFPNLRTEELARTHDIYSVYFKIVERPPYRKGKNPQYPLYAVFDGDRLIGVIGLNGFQCAWSDVGAAVYASECAQMMANIYIYAMTR